jgi:putative transposase
MSDFSFSSVAANTGTVSNIILLNMPRKARLNQPGLTHHIMARTFNELLLFGDDADRTFYLSCLSRRIKETGFICYAWVLMDTHVHLLMRTTEKPLWQVMKPLNCDYAHYYNKKYNRRGPLFSDRYKSIATQDQYYLEHLIRYIHLNPIRAGICKTVRHLDRYPWSGHRAIMENANNGFQEVNQVLRRFGKTTGEAQKKYREFIKDGVGVSSEEEFLSAVRASNTGRRGKDASHFWVIGDAAFQKSVFKKDTQNRLTLARYKKEGISLEDVLKKTARKTEVNEKLILCKSKRTPQAAARMIFCYLARELGFPTRETGTFLGVQQAAVSNAARYGAVLAHKQKICWEKNEPIV